MLRAANDPQNLEIVVCEGAASSATGNVKDRFFDDEAWTIRHRAISTGSGRPGHDVPAGPTREAQNQAPWHDPAPPLWCETEIAVRKHDGRAARWPDAETDAKTDSERAALTPAA